MGPCGCRLEKDVLALDTEGQTRRSEGREFGLNHRAATGIDRDLNRKKQWLRGSGLGIGGLQFQRDPRGDPLEIGEPQRTVHFKEKVSAERNPEPPSRTQPGSRHGQCALNIFRGSNRGGGGAPDLAAAAVFLSEF